MKKLGLIVLTIILFSSIVYADLVPAGQKYVDYCFIIENQKDFSDYTFILHGGPLTDAKIIPEGECVHFYKAAQPYIHAIKNSEFDNQTLNSLLRPKSSEDMQKLNDYFDANSYMLKSNLQLKNYGYVSTSDPLKEAKDILTIKFLGNGFIIEKNKIIYTYENGENEEKMYDSKEFPNSKINILVYFVYFGIPLVCLILLIVLLRRKND